MLVCKFVCISPCLAVDHGSLCRMEMATSSGSQPAGLLAGCFVPSPGQCGDGAPEFEDVARLFVRPNGRC